MAQGGRPARARDMVLSLVVIVVPLAIITMVLTGGPPDAKVETVNWKPVAAEAQRQAPYQVLAPVELPAGWRATRVSWTRIGEAAPTGEQSVRNRWQLGVLTDADVYIELDQGDKQPADMVTDLSRHGQPDGTMAIDGQTWKRLVSDDDRTRSVVLTTPRVTTIVTGDTDYQQLATLVGLLHSEP